VPLGAWGYSRGYTAFASTKKFERSRAVSMFLEAGATDHLDVKAALALV
jgi:hypothetical protein